MIAGSSSSVAGFPLEGVFHVYLQRRFPFFRHQRRRLLEEYLTRPRYVDAGRTEVEYPIDYFDTDIETLVREMPDEIDHPIRLFAWLLERYAAVQGRQSWAIFDLLPELRYSTYRALVPGIRLAVMQRAPEEAIAEGMFWRTYPAPPPDRAQRFRSLLFQWCLSRTVARAMTARFGEDVAIFSFNALTGGDDAERTRLAGTFDIPTIAVRDAYAFTPPFNYTPEAGFLGPDGVQRHLLTDDELLRITAARAERPTRGDMSGLLGLAPRAPVLARNLGDLIVYPRTMAIRRVNALRQFAIDALAGIRLSMNGLA